jgi:hypothetical protein
MSRRSNFTGESRLSLETSRANASPSWTRAIRIVRSLLARSMSLAHREKVRSTAWLTAGSRASIWSLGPVPTTSLASVRTMPLA